MKAQRFPPSLTKNYDNFRGTPCFRLNVCLLCCMMNDDYWEIEPRFMNLSVCLRVSGSLMEKQELVRMNEEILQEIRTEVEKSKLEIIQLIRDEIQKIRT